MHLAGDSVGNVVKFHSGCNVGDVIGFNSGLNMGLLTSEGDRVCGIEGGDSGRGINDNSIVHIKSLKPVAVFKYLV